MSVHSFITSKVNILGKSAFSPPFLFPARRLKPGGRSIFANVPGEGPDMKADKIREETDRRFHKMTLAYDQAGKDFGPEEVHVFRVRVKKLRSLLRLWSAAGREISFPSDLRH